MSEYMCDARQNSPLRICASSPTVSVGDADANAEAAIVAIRRAQAINADFLVLPELFLSGATIGSLAYHKSIITSCKEALKRVAESTRRTDITVSIGLPYEIDNTVKSCIALLRRGRVAAIIPAAIHASNPFGFVPSVERSRCAHNALTPVSMVDVGFAEDIFSVNDAHSGYVMLLSGSLNATAKSYDMVRNALSSYSARTGCAAAMALSGRGESSSSFVFDGYCAIAANGKILSESTPLEKEPFIYADIRTDKLCSFEPPSSPCDMGDYVSNDEACAHKQLERLFSLQSAALVRRAEHIGVKGFIIGVSGGLDSALALLVACAAADEMGLGRESILGVSMPGFGTTSRTFNNSRNLVESLGCKYMEIPIAAACRKHFEDIGHDESIHNAVYENAQARERTQILLSLANKHGLLDVGTGDLSEAALGWTTFGGDHLAQYGVNASLPKTVVRRVVSAVGSRFGEEANAVLSDILATPVSPELLPSDGDNIVQKTEELVGNYELHDLFIYHFLKGMGPKELYELALNRTDFDEEEIYRTLGTFLRRFFSQQFKRNCAPEAPIVCLSIAPAVWTMPSDMSGRAFMREYEQIERKYR